MTSFLTGIGWVTAGGLGRGRSGADFNMATGRLPTLSSKEVAGRPCRRFDRMDTYSQLGLTAIGLALKDAGLDRWTEKRPFDIVVSTVYGCLATDIEYFDTVIPQEGLLASPSLFAYTLPSSFLGEAAIHFGLSGASCIVNEKVPLALKCVRMALQSLAWGECATVLAGVCDLECPPPYDGLGATPSGAAFLLLENTLREPISPYGTILLEGGSDVLFDGTPVQDLPGLIRLCVKNRPAKIPT